MSERTAAVPVAAEQVMEVFETHPRTGTNADIMLSPGRHQGAAHG
jgi:hypothetical protein